MTPYRIAAIDEDAVMAAAEERAFERSVRGPSVHVRVALLLLGVVVLPMTLALVVSVTRKIDLGTIRCHEAEHVTVAYTGLTSRITTVCD